MSTTTGFRFALDTLLNLRQRAEDEARRHLAATQRERGEQAARLAACEQAYAIASQAAMASASGEDLLDQALHLQHRRRQVAHQQQRLRQCLQREETQQARLQAAVRERQVLDQLKAQRWRQYLASRERHQQQALDEAGMMVHQARQGAS